MRMPSERPEQLNEMLDPHRREEIAGAALELSGRLFQKGVEVSSDEDPADLADLLSAVERFEQAVINRGGDLMVNMPDSADPQDPAFVLPVRRADESIRDYIGHIGEASTMLEEPRRALALGSLPVARRAAGFFEQCNRRDCHSAIDRLRHVVDGEERRGSCDERFHLDACSLDCSRQSLNTNAGQCIVERELHLQIGQRYLMTERDSVRRSLRRHDAGNASDAEHIAFFEGVRSYRVHSRRMTS